VSVAKLPGEPEPAPKALSAQGEREPSVSAIARHAAFLSGTALEELLRLHRLYAPKALAPVRDYWIRALARGVAEGADAEVVGEALVALSALTVAQATGRVA
jgi:hypothetical protein